MQIAIIPVADTHVEYASKAWPPPYARKTSGLNLILQNESMGKKIRAAKQQKLPYFIVIGDKETENHEVTLKLVIPETNQSISVKELIASLSDERDN